MSLPELIPENKENKNCESMFKNIYYCFCRNTQKFINEPTQKTPLLSHDQKQGSPEAVINQPAHVPVASNGYYHSSSTDEGKQPKKHGGRPRKISVGFTNVKAVDKRLQDHKKLYNEYYQKYDDLQSYCTELCNAFPDENPDRTMEETFKLLRQKTRDCESLRVSRKPQHGCTRVEFNAPEVPNDVLIQLNKFNSANKLIKELNEKGPKLIESVHMLLKDETDLRRDVLAASMGTDGPDCMKMCIGGINELRKVPGFVEEILKRCKKTHKKTQKCVQLLMQDEAEENSDVIAKVHTSTSGTNTNSSAEETEQSGNKPLIDIENETEPKTKVSPARTQEPVVETHEIPSETPQPTSETENQQGKTTQEEKTVSQETQPDTEEAQSETEAAQPDAEEAQPETKEAQPETDEAQPESEEAQPETEEAQPVTEEAQPETAEAQPETEEAQPETEESQPETEEPQPETENAPTRTEDTQPENQKSPSETQEASVETEQAQSETEETPAETTEQPVEIELEQNKEEQTSATEEKPR